MPGYKKKVKYSAFVSESLRNITFLNRYLQIAIT